MRCLYHPLASATYFCPTCDASYCDTCTHREAPSFERCFVCGSAVQSLGSAYSATPFWRRLDKSFRYPLSGHAIAMIVGASIIITLAAFLPFSFFIILAASGVFVKYSFACLENSAYGDFKPVDIDEGFGGGVGLLLQLFGILIVVMIAIGAAFAAFGQAVGSFLSVLFIAGGPAILINFALSQSFVHALNPLAMLSLMKKIGLPYGLLLGIILIMAGSVGVITQILAKDMSTISIILQSVVSNYYTIVTFHIMGYMIFQYQERLGFSAREDYGDDHVERSEAEILAAQIDIWTKEADKEKVIDLFNDAVSRFPQEKPFFEKCFNFLIETKEYDRLKKFIPIYFQHLEDTSSYDTLYHTYKRLRAMKVKLTLQTPAQRYRVAKMAQKRGDHQLVIELLGGFHKTYPDFKNLPDAVKIIASSLECVPQHAALAPKYQQLAKQLAVKAAQKPQADFKPMKDGASGAVSLSLTPKLDDESKESAPVETNTENADSGKDLPPIDFPGFSK